MRTDASRVFSPACSALELGLTDASGVLVSFCSYRLYVSLVGSYTEHWVVPPKSVVVAGGCVWGLPLLLVRHIL